MRGKAFRRKAYEHAARITPAYAGKSPMGMLLQVTCRDHPRLCGEKRRLSWSIVRYSGSPPPMRGKEVFGNEAFQKARITPAYAGKSCIMHSKSPKGRDHPRLCGEKSRGVLTSITT